ncbi:phage tail protein [Pedobacter metabolipauper]|uniref:Microcystin-dependent protein n=1 Tax=Pedobacter metabolipauper TaxID=425513 RepID=A0A4R6SS02_9SPHI|nr:tail fiber protein [Pedobacter metabolipauper]TDQ08057.1 microcystin-dependent protein [Pedobacter metabolipauper]
MDNYIGEIRMFTGQRPPENWDFCEGQLLKTYEYDMLFNVIGTNYGGDGQTTFALPDLRGRVPIHAVGSATLPNINLGQRGGTETNVLKESNLPPHGHKMYATNAAGNANIPTNAIFANTGTETEPDKEYVEDTLINAAINRGAISSNDSKNLPVNNVQPFFTMGFIIALKGIYPSMP